MRDKLLPAEQRLLPCLQSEALSFQMMALLIVAASCVTLLYSVFLTAQEGFSTRDACCKVDGNGEYKHFIFVAVRANSKTNL